MSNNELDRVKQILLRNKRKGRGQKGPYVRPEVTEQDRISQDPAEVKKKLKDFTIIEREDYSYVQPGTFVRYLKKLKNGRYKYCHGGMLIVNASPVYWVLKSTQRGKEILWSVQLQSDNIYYRKEMSEVTQKTMQEMYNAIKSGEYRLIKTEYLIKLINNQHSGGHGNGGYNVTKISNDDGNHYRESMLQECSDEDSDFSDESSTMESDDDSDEKRRPTYVQLV